MIGLLDKDGWLVRAVESIANMDMTGLTQAPAPPPSDYQTKRYRWVSGVWQWDVEQARLLALDMIDDQRERRQMTRLTQGGAKKYVYNRKRDEARDYRSLSGTVLATLLAITGLSQRRERFPYAQTEAEARGMTLTQVIETYEAGILTADAKLKEFEAVAMKAKAAVRAATSANQIQSITAAIAWPSA